jgi:hypothetical protein
MIIAGQTLFFLNMWWTARVAAMAAGAPGSVMPAGLDSKL